MKIKEIKYPSPLSEIKDIENDNIDIIVETDDEMMYSFVVTTPKNYYWYMDKEKVDYIPASSHDIIVRSLTEENIRKAVESYLDEDGYWLKLYFLAGRRNGIFKVEEMNKILDEIKQENREVFGET